MAIRSKDNKNIKAGKIAAGAATLFGTGYLVGKKRAKTQSSFHKFVDSLTDKINDLHD